MRWRVFVMALTVAAASCSTSPSASDSRTAADAGSKAVLYTTFTDLAEDSTAIVRATYTGPTVIESVATPTGLLYFPVSTFTINQAVAGAVGTPTIQIRSVAVTASSAGTTTPVPLIADGGEWLLFIQPFHFTAGDNTGQWIVTGEPSGAYRKSGNTSIYNVLDIENAALPRTATVAEVSGLTLGDGSSRNLDQPVQGGPAVFTLSPGRIMDTRPGGETVDDVAEKDGIRTTGSTTTLQVTGRHGVPSGAIAAIVNLTVAGPLAAGFITVYPCDAAQPTTSNLNFVAGQTVPNSVWASLSAAGTTCIYTSVATHVIVDVSGYVLPSAGYTALTPGRLLDTRPGPTVDGGNTPGLVTAGSTLTIQVRGRHGIPTEATAAVFNITSVSAQQSGFLTVYPCDAAQPNASNLNFLAGQTVPNAVVSSLSAAGTICVYVSATTHLIVDVAGHLVPASGYVPLVPGRLVDTRPGQSTVDGQNRPGAKFGGVMTVDIAGRYGVPVDAASVVLNVTVIQPTSAGYLTVYPCGPTMPIASNLNYSAGDVVANAVVVPAGDLGRVCFYSTGVTDMAVDIVGYVP